MSNHKSVLLLTALISALITCTAVTQPLAVVSDSSKAQIMEYSRLQHQNSRSVQNLQTHHYFQNENRDCKALSDSLSRTIKIFEPDTTLTAAMPVLKPGLIDPKIFIPRYNCTGPYSNNSTTPNN